MYNIFLDFVLIIDVKYAKEGFGSMKQKLVWMLTIVVALILCMPFCAQPAALASQSGETSTPPRLFS